MNQSIYSEILASLGWFDTGMGKPEPFDPDCRHVYPAISIHEPITPRTRVAYFPGCFAEFHAGHAKVIRQCIAHMKKFGEDYRVIIAPANADYTMSKYGDVEQASNKYRYEGIKRWLESTIGVGRVHIDLNPMLNFDRDHNFPDLIDDFLKGHGLSIDAMIVPPSIVSGKDRENFGKIAALSNKIQAFYFPGDDSFSSSNIMAAQGQRPRVKKDLILRCLYENQALVFEKYFGDQYKSIRPLYQSFELLCAEQVVKAHKFDFTICKEYAGLGGLKYHRLSRAWTNPLGQAPSFWDYGLPDLDGMHILDSDAFSGSTRKYIESRGGKLFTMFSGDPETTEIIDFKDIARGDMAYPMADVSWRCSMQPFTKEFHQKFNEFREVAGRT